MAFPSYVTYRTLWGKLKQETRPNESFVKKHFPRRRENKDRRSPSSKKRTGAGRWNMHAGAMRRAKCGLWRELKREIVPKLKPLFHHSVNVATRVHFKKTAPEANGTRAGKACSKCEAFRRTTQYHGAALRTRSEPEAKPQDVIFD
jgi:hypothetical protein